MTSSKSTRPTPGRSITEVAMETPVPCLVQPEWRERWPDLAQGLTAPGPTRAWDFRLFDGAGCGALERWSLLGAGARCDAVVHARQPHGTAVRTHGPLAPGLHLSEAVDAHATRHPGVLLAVTVADCVPAFIVAADRRAAAAVHAGWRGTAAGVLETAIATLGDRFGIATEELDLHLGPAICGDCYEVGPEVHEALGEGRRSGPAPVDLRANLSRRGVEAGVPAERITLSTLCTRCGPVDLYSHRGGDAGRQVAFLGWR